MAPHGAAEGRNDHANRGASRPASDIPRTAGCQARACPVCGRGDDRTRSTVTLSCADASHDGLSTAQACRARRRADNRVRANARPRPVGDGSGSEKSLRAAAKSWIRNCGRISAPWKSKERKAVADAELEQLRIQEWRAYELCNTEFRKQERYCKEQREALHALEELKVQEKPMYELDHRKDQVMTVYKVALAKSLRHRTLFQFYPEYRTFPSHFSLLSERKVLSSRCATRGLMGMPAVARVAREMSKRPIMRCIPRFLSEYFVPFSCLPRAPHLIFCTLGSKR